MDDNRYELGTCRSKVGMLFLRDCGEPAVAECVVCKRPVCMKHLVEVENGAACVECAADNPKVKPRGSVFQTRRRRSYYSSYGYSPFYYGGHRYYSDRDYRTFDDRRAVTTEPHDETQAAAAAAAAASAEADGSHDSFDDDDPGDFTES